MKKKIFVTRRLLKENEEKLQSLFEVTLNKDDKIYTSQEIIDRSKNYDGSDRKSRDYSYSPPQDLLL